MPERIALCRVEEVAPGTAVKVEAGDLVVAVFNIGGAFHVMDDACTHGPGSLSQGDIEDEVITCNFHGGQFDIRTGEVVGPPCMIAQRVYKTVVEDGRVFIERSSE